MRPNAHKHTQWASHLAGVPQRGQVAQQGHVVVVCLREAQSRVRDEAPRRDARGLRAVSSRLQPRAHGTVIQDQPSRCKCAAGTCKHTSEVLEHVQ